VTNEQLTKLVEEHGAVEKVQVMYDKYSGRSRRFGFATMKSVEDANAVVEKLNGNTVEGREIKVNITEKPIASSPDLSVLQSEDSAFVDSPYKVYVGNLAKTVTKEMLENLFSEKGKVVSAKVSRVPGTSKSTGFGFVTFSSEEDVEAAIVALNNSLLEGQKIRVNKA
jgi:polyadenylate-binding protein